jgi:hypothetical protein
LAKANLVAVVPTALSCIAGVFSVDTGLEKNFLEGHGGIFSLSVDSGKHLVVLCLALGIAD